MPTHQNYSSRIKNVRRFRLILKNLEQAGVNLTLVEKDYEQAIPNVSGGCRTVTDLLAMCYTAVENLKELI